MSKLVCVNCEVEYRAKTNGVLVIETASFGAYKVWQADLLECPVCLNKIVGGFANIPLRQDHYKPDFPEWLEKAKQEAPLVIYDNEVRRG
ncbi:MAG: hypothetical protein A2Y53_00100 [Chloroflexi bacterium RBG_16_47_49]|nr:MAG: hypothetical protein A2Y53_00100 [Chloroflexi bacterium RBG_16_47_49]